MKTFKGWKLFKFPAAETTFAGVLMKIINEKSRARHTCKFGRFCVNYNHLGRIKAYIYYIKKNIILTCVNFAKFPVTVTKLEPIILASIIVRYWYRATNDGTSETLLAAAPALWGAFVFFSYDFVLDFLQAGPCPFTNPVSANWRVARKARKIRRRWLYVIFSENQYL